MLIFLLIGFIMAALAVLFWYMELVPFLSATRNKPWYVYPFAIIFNLPKLAPFLIDVAITLFCVGNLGFGAGVLGGVTGLFISNVISCFILYRGYKARRVRIA